MERIVLGRDDIFRAFSRIVCGIVEASCGVDDLVLLGVLARGVVGVR